MPVREVEIARAQAVVAARPLTVGTMVTKDDVKVVPWPAANQVPGSFTEIDKVVNRGVILATAENEPLTEAKLAAVGSGAGLPPTIPEGMRAISVKVNEVIGVAGFVIPGTRVDVMVTVRRPGNDNTSQTRVVLEQRDRPHCRHSFRSGAGDCRGQGDSNQRGHAAPDAGRRREDDAGV